MNKQVIILLILPFLLVIVNCKNDSKTTSKMGIDKVDETVITMNLPDNDAGDIIQKAINFSGGWEQWANKKNLSYTKKITYFDSLENKIREVKQLHQYQLKPNLKMRISWEQDGNLYEIRNNGEQALKFKNGEVLSGEEINNSAWNSSYGSHYVMCIPFKLTDPGTILTYEGLDTLAANHVVHSIKVIYEKGAGSAAGMHTWWYYFDNHNYKLIANFLDYGNGFSYTQYESFKEVANIKINQQRKSYRTNKNRDLLYIGTVYTNENIQFDTTFEEGLFDMNN